MHILSQTLGLIKKAYKERRRVVTVPRTRIILNILQLFYDESVIRGFFVSDDLKKIIVYLKYYEEKPLIYDFKICSTPRKEIFVSHKVLSKYIVSNGLYVLSTNKNGLIFSNRLLKKNSKLKNKIGGKLLFQIFV